MIDWSIQVDPLVSLMMVEKVPDSTYEMVGGLDKQIKEIKEVILRIYILMWIRILDPPLNLTFWNILKIIFYLRKITFFYRLL